MSDGTASRILRVGDVVLSAEQAQAQREEMEALRARLATVEAEVERTTKALVELGGGGSSVGEPCVGVAAAERYTEAELKRAMADARYDAPKDDFGAILDRIKQGRDK